MAIQPISEIGGAPASAALAAEYLHVAHPPQSELALAESKAKEQQTTEQLANEGDPQALIQLAKEEKQLTPINEQQLLPAAREHAPGAHEAGKGELIDVYD